MTCCRSTEVARLSGGVSTLYKHGLRGFFGDGGESGTPQHNADAGVMLDFGDGSEPVLVRMRLACLVADALGIKEATGWKGASGLKPCLKCTNVILAKSKTAMDAPAVLPGGLLRSTSLDVDHFVPSTDTIVHGILRRLAEESAAGGNLETLSKNLGWNFSADSWGTDVSLPRPLVSAVHFDWMHCYFIAGVFTVEVCVCVCVCVSLYLFKK